MLAAALMLCGVLSCAQNAEPVPETRWVPFELFRDGWVFMKARVNGVEMLAVLDSGAGITCLDTRLARELGLEGGTPVGAEGIGGTVSAEMFQGVDFEVGDIEAKDVSVVVLDLSDVARGLGRELPAILGRNFFTDYVVDIDYPKQRVAFRDTHTFEYDGPGFELQLVGAASGLWAVELELGGKLRRLLVDTGSGGPIGIDGATARSCGLFGDDVQSTTTLSGGVGGMGVARLATLSELVVGDTVLEEVPIRFSVEEEPASKGDVGGIGTPLLSRFRVLFDTRRDRLILEPDAARVAESFPKNRVGLVVQPESGGLRVAHVCEGSPAAAAGWKAGELVVSIDGQPTGDNYWRGLHHWQNAPAGTLVVLVDSEGRRRELRAADFY